MATTTTTTPGTTMTPPSTAPATLAKGAGVGIGLALIANLVVFAIGNTGAPLQVVMNGESEPSDLALGAVISASIAPVIIGALGLWMFERFLTNGFRIWAVTVLVLAVVTIAAPAGLDIDTGSKIALGTMHVIVGAAAVAGQWLARRSTPTSR